MAQKPTHNRGKWGWTLPVCVGTLGVSKRTGNVLPIRCKQWSCPTCARINSLVLSIKVVEGIKKFQEQERPLSFITLTAWGRYSKNPALAYSELPNWWNSLRERLKYLSGPKKLEYAAFIEEQSRGVPHLHAIATVDLSTKGLKELAVKSGFGHQAKSDPVKSPAVGWYVAKYLTKADGTMPNAPKNHRRVRFSSNWPELPSPNPSTDLVVKERNETIISWAFRAQAEGVHKPVAEILGGAQRILAARDLELTLAELEGGVDIPLEFEYCYDD